MIDEQIQFNDQHKITLYGMGLVPDPAIGAPHAYMVDGEMVRVNPVVWNGLIQALRDSTKINDSQAAQLFYYENGTAMVGQYTGGHDDFITKLCFDMVVSKQKGMWRVPMIMGRSRQAVAIADKIVEFLDGKHGEDFKGDKTHISAIILRAIADLG